MLEYDPDTCVIYDGDRPICEMSTTATSKDVAMILEARGGWHLANDAAKGLRVECDSDIGYEANFIRSERDALRAENARLIGVLDEAEGMVESLNALPRCGSGID